jgi:dTDP-4-amino-4,6-dideoxygalactose transaminase
MEAFRGARRFALEGRQCPTALYRFRNHILEVCEKELVLDALDSGWALRKYIDEFEANFERYCGTEYAIAVSNGTTGLHLALAALGLQPGDEVVIPI